MLADSFTDILAQAAEENGGLYLLCSDLLGYVLTASRQVQSWRVFLHQEPKGQQLKKKDYMKRMVRMVNGDDRLADRRRTAKKSAGTNEEQAHKPTKGRLLQNTLDTFPSTTRSLGYNLSMTLTTTCIIDKERYTSIELRSAKICISYEEGWHWTKCWKSGYGTDC
ncbi:hypothetical protein BC941DRAFT_515277 [Chlamydoabsidia padenii]|nr:hypothetical protein BC941DRAFT_515277 [Chlamydoabsidia padenii]